MSNQKKVDRTPREIEERGFEEREMFESPDMSFLDRGLLYFDPKLVPPGREWGWVVSKIHFQAQDFSQARRKGWQPINANKYPELNYFSMGIDINKEASSIIEVGGQVLCERPLAVKEAQDAHYQKIKESVEDRLTDFVDSRGVQMYRREKNYSTRPLEFGS